MSTKIPWTDETWNAVTGCSKVSSGCTNCYAACQWKRFSAMANTKYTGRKFTDVQCHDTILERPFLWRRPRKIFVNSMSDLFHEDVPDSFIDKIFAVMAACPQHTFQVLTKRPKRMRSYMQECNRERIVTAVRDMPNMPISKSAFWARIESRAWPLLNVWLGVSVEHQAAADERIPYLLDTPAAIRFVSAEPLLGELNVAWALSRNRMEIAAGFLERGHFSPGLEKLRGLDWIVTGGETGPKARPALLDWLRSARDQCAAESIPFFLKSRGEYVNAEDFRPGRLPKAFRTLGSTHFFRVPSRKIHHLFGGAECFRRLDGVVHDALPEVRP